MGSARRDSFALRFAVETKTGTKASSRLRFGSLRLLHCYCIIGRVFLAEHVCVRAAVSSGAVPMAAHAVDAMRKISHRRRRSEFPFHCYFSSQRTVASHDLWTLYGSCSNTPSGE